MILFINTFITDKVMPGSQVQAHRQWNRQYLKEFSSKDSLVVLISSSGNSKNILNCAQYCVDNKLKHIILTGFDSNNKLRTLTKKGHIKYIFR